MGVESAQTLDAQTLDAQTLDAQTLDAQTLDAQTLDVQTLDARPTLDNSQPVNFATAADYVLKHSHKLLAAQAGLRASQLQAEALDDLQQPLVAVSGMAGRYRVATDISTERLRNRLKGYGDNLTAKIDALTGYLPPRVSQALMPYVPSTDALLSRLPTSVHVSKRDDFTRANVVALMPLYTGGRIPAIQQFAHGRADVQASEVATTEEELLTQLIQRYFQVQLAEQVVKVRRAALKAVKAHDHAAQRMLDVGLIARAERLQGSRALAEADFELKKAEDNARLARRALEALLQTNNLDLGTKLFVNRQPLKPLTHWQEKARAHHPAFAKINAKTQQAEAMKNLSDAAWKPNLNAFGSREVGGDNNWVVGINATWTLHSPIDRDKRQQAARETLKQIDAVRQQAEQDINLLVEKNWLSVKDARQRYDSLAETERLAKQVLKLNRAGFKEGLNTVMEVNDAHAKLIKAQTQRVHAAYEYVIALSELLAASGELHDFEHYVEP
ncbi:MAG: hypothetical protein CR974_02070 [Gammaproteobacteria bacterium]|nr:MAG: hypothetical protein CR974_02070 [Gammaproteobacteria bacterium]